MDTPARIISLAAGLFATAAGLAWVGARIPGPAASEPPPPTPTNAQLLQRGAYLMSSLGCNDCHTPHDERGQPIGSLYLAGHPADAPLPEWDPSMLERNVLVTISPTLTAFAGPFGTSVAPNITPNKEAGIGNLSAEELIRSWRTKKHWAVDRPIMPPMPAQAYSTLTDDDIRALHAFLMSLPPNPNKPPASRPALPGA